jgi:hypothetical protein
MLTIQAGVIWLYICLLNLAVIYDQSIPFTSLTTKDSSGSIKGKVKSFGKVQRWIGDEADLILDMSVLSACRVIHHDLREYKTYTAFARRIKGFGPRVHSVHIVVLAFPLWSNYWRRF